VSGSDDDRVVVIGGGPTAAMAASELVRGGAAVTMLDAGHRAPRGVVVRAGGKILFRWVEQRQLAVNRQVSATDPDTEWYSSLSLGGLTNYWTGAVPRFAPEDFTDGGRVDPRYVWPITYDDLAPFYDIAEAAITVTAGDALVNVPPARAAHRHDLPADWAAVTAAAAGKGHGLAPMPLANGTPWMIAARGNEFTSYHCVVKPLLRSPRFGLQRGARVIRLRHSPSSGAVEAAVVAGRDGEREVRGRAFVVAAGALDTTEILLRSTSADFPTGLGNGSGLLGTYLHDHPRVWWAAQLSRPMQALSHPLYMSRGPFDDAPPMMACGMTIGLASPRDRLRALFGGRCDRVGVQVLGTMVPTPESSVTLAEPAVGASSHLAIDLTFDDAARRNLAAAGERFATVLADAGLPAEVGPSHELHPGQSVHLGGTVRMHRDPSLGVLDEWNRMHEVPNVVVCDSSCFTTGPEKNPTLTAMAIAARAGRRLAELL
jgi:choline dehydrogenase-like flavoprotein